LACGRRQHACLPSCPPALHTDTVCAPTPAAALTHTHTAPRKEQLPDECKLYVGNLPPTYDSAMLRQLFEPHAPVSHSAVITEPVTNISRGFGFVHIPDVAQVAAAAAAARARAPTDGTRPCTRRSTAPGTLVWPLLVLPRALPSACLALCHSPPRTPPHTHPHTRLQAKATRQLMDGHLVDGRALVVRLRTERGQPGGTAGACGGARAWVARLGRVSVCATRAADVRRAPCQPPAAWHACVLTMLPCLHAAATRRPARGGRDQAVRRGAAAGRAGGRAPRHLWQVRA
jgi:hypothetical protein